MADNIAVTPGTGTTVPCATDEVGGVHYQINKLAFGALDTVTLVSGADPLPVSGDVTVSGTIPVSGTFWQATQPVSIASTVAVSGPLTDVQLRAADVPVSGTFWQATQPVSGTVGISGSVAVTGTFWQATQPVSGTVTANLGTIAGVATETTLAALNTKTPSLGQATMANSSPIVIASNQSALPVTGTFWQATQPVSGTVTANAGTGTFAVSFTQPALVAGSAIIGKVGIDQTTPGTTNKVSIGTDGTVAVGSALPAGTNNIGDVDVLSLPALPAGSNNIGTTNGPTLTKGTQGSIGHSVQDLKDAGRVLFSAATVIGGVTAVSTEALLSLVATRAGVAAAGATSQAVTSGKTLRVTGIIAGVRSSAATVLSGRVALRMNPSGAAVASSPIIAILSMTQQAAAIAEAGDTCVFAVPDGLEFSGTQQIGLTQVCSGTGGVVYASIVGFEY